MEKPTVYTQAQIDEMSYIKLLKVAKANGIRFDTNPKEAELKKLIMDSQDPADTNAAARLIDPKQLSPFQVDLGQVFMKIRSKKTATYRKNKATQAVFDKYGDAIPAEALEEQFNAVLNAYVDGQTFEIEPVKSPKSKTSPKKKTSSKSKTSPKKKTTLDRDALIARMSDEAKATFENKSIQKSTKMRTMFAEGFSVKEVSTMMECHYSFAYGVKNKMKASVDSISEKESLDKKEVK